MRRLMLMLSAMAVAGVAHADTNSDLEQAVGAFVAEEMDDAPPDMHATLAACIMPVFDGLDDAMIAAVLAKEDFEQGLGVVLTAYPEREQIIEDCEKLVN